LKLKLNILVEKKYKKNSFISIGRMNQLSNPIRYLTLKEKLIWICSLLIVAVTNIFIGDFDFLTLIASCIGVTSLILAAKGNVWSQILMIIFSILYGIISAQFHYWGEMITYLGMTMPMAIFSTITWLKNPSENGKEVRIQKLTNQHIIILLLSSMLVTFLFYIILARLKTPNLIFSTISITTSFLAASLTMLRSSYYAIGYAANDLILITLWTLATLQNPLYLSVIIIFVIFFFYDIYGFVSWKQREK